MVTDRVDLDDQIVKTLAASGTVSDARASHAQSGAHLRRLLGENKRHVFTIIHKFQSDAVLTRRRDVIVVADEVRRSSHNDLMLNMRAGRRT